MGEIDWKRVSDRLRCPICGDKAHIAPETDGTEGMHTHRFGISRADAERLSLPTKEEAQRRIAEIEAELASLRPIVDQPAPTSAPRPEEG